MSRNPVGEILVRAGLLSKTRLDEISAELPRSGPSRLVATLVDHNVVHDRDIARILSLELSVPWVSLAHADPPRSVSTLVPHDVAERHCMAPVYVRREPKGPPTLFVAIDDPTNEEALYTVAVFAGMAVRPVIAPRSEIRALIARWYQRTVPQERPTLPVVAMNESDLEELFVLDRRAAH